MMRNMGARQSEVVRQAVNYYHYLIKNEFTTVTRHAVAKKYGISPSTLYRALKRRKERK
jgi:DNA invertase Pin-like site-specific DNA recombinase